MSQDREPENARPDDRDRAKETERLEKERRDRILGPERTPDNMREVGTHYHVEKVPVPPEGMPNVGSYWRNNPEERAKLERRLELIGLDANVKAAIELAKLSQGRPPEEAVREVPSPGESGRESKSKGGIEARGRDKGIEPKGK